LESEKEEEKEEALKRQQKIHLYFEQNLAQIRKQMRQRNEMKELARMYQHLTRKYLKKRKKGKKKNEIAELFKNMSESTMKLQLFHHPDSNISKLIRSKPKLFEKLTRKRQEKK